MKSSIDVDNFLTSLGIPHEMFTIPRPIRDILAAAATLGIKSSAVVKPQFYTAGDRKIMVLISGDKKIDMEKLRKEVKAEKVEEIDSEKLATLTRYFPGATPPVALDNDIGTYIDFYCLREDVVYTSGGGHSNILKIRSYDLVRATEAEIVDVVAQEEGDQG